MATLAVSPTEEQLDALLKAEPAPPPGESRKPNPRKPNQRAEQFAQTMVLAALFAGPALICVHAACANDPDIWWHMRAGEWMLQHHAVAHADPFSGPNAGKPWAAYSWLFELLSLKLFQGFGLVGIVGYSAAMVLAIGVALQHMVRRLQADFSVVVLLAFTTCYSLEHLFTPRPWMFTILFFVLEIDILMHARRTGRTRELAWLPLNFALWSNLHIQFIDGLLMLGLAVAEAVGARWGLWAKTRLRAEWLVGALAASVLATMVNPFGWHIYRVAYDLAAQPGVLNKISELQAIPFRSLTDYCLLLLALAAAGALAWSRRFRMFEAGLFIFAAVVSFRSQRDLWVMATVAAAILASTIAGKNKTAVRLPRFATMAAVAVAAVMVLIGFRAMHVNNQLLEEQVAKTLPADAVNAIRAKGYAGPLYNDYTWGGYLIWALRMPVSLDGRAAFYGDDAIDRSVATWNAEPDWKSDPQLAKAGLVLGPAKSALTQVLRLDPRFQLVYEDKLAAVFVARK